MKTFTGQKMFNVGSIIQLILRYCQENLFLKSCYSTKVRFAGNNSRYFGIYTYLFYFFYVFSTVHHSIDLFHLPTLMHNSFIY